MNSTIYDPFEKFSFDNNTCFLTGEKLDGNQTLLPVFPKWILDEYELHDKVFGMLDERTSFYGKLFLPASEKVVKAIQSLDSKVQKAILEGYEHLESISETELFQWVGTIFYGILFNEIQAGVRQAAAQGEPMNFSNSLIHKFRNLHHMLISLIEDYEFEHVNPFKVLVFDVENSPETFLYRDEVNTLIFSLRMKNIGLIVTLQDNGSSSIFHQELLEKLKGKKLQPIQFEEISAKFYYSAFLFNRLPEYSFMQVEGKTYVEPMPLQDFTQKPLFDKWEVKTYGQVLENFWKPWGYTLFEIIKDPEKPMSFLFNENDEWVEKENIQV